MIYLLRLVISSRASLRAIFKSVFPGWFLNYSAVHQKMTISTQTTKRCLRAIFPNLDKSGKQAPKNSIKFKIDYPYLYALILKAFYFWSLLEFSKKSIFSWFLKMSNFGSKIFAWGCICLYKNSFIHQKEFLSRFRLRKGDSRSMTHVMSHR